MPRPNQRRHQILKNLTNAAAIIRGNTVVRHLHLACVLSASCLNVCLSVCLSIYLSVYISLAANYHLLIKIANVQLPYGLVAQLIEKQWSVPEGSDPTGMKDFPLPEYMRTEGPIPF